MTLIQTTPPALELVSLAETKAHLRLETTADDLLLSTLVVAARQQIEKSLQIRFISQSLSLFVDAWPDPATPIASPAEPIVQLIAVRTFAPDDTSTALPIAGFELDRGPPPRIVARKGTRIAGPLRRLNAIEIAFTAGFGPSATDVPHALRQVVLQLVTHLYEHRGLAMDDAPMSALEPLLAPWRRPRLV